MRIGPLGIWELLILLVVILLIFGSRRLPEMARSISRSIREFRNAVREIKDDSDTKTADTTDEHHSDKESG